MTINREALAAAWEDLKSLSFPEHPDDLDLAEWLLELTELDGYIAGLAVTALGSWPVAAMPGNTAAEHEGRLSELRVVGRDELVYEASVAYVSALVRVEAALAGRAPQPD